MEGYTSYLFYKITLFNNKIRGILIKPLRTNLKEGIYRGPRLTVTALAELGRT